MDENVKVPDKHRPTVDCLQTGKTLWVPRGVASAAEAYFRVYGHIYHEL
jgi:hypothetical protein